MQKTAMCFEYLSTQYDSLRLRVLLYFLVLEKEVKGATEMLRGIKCLLPFRYQTRDNGSNQAECFPGKVEELTKCHKELYWQLKITPWKERLCRLPVAIFYLIRKFFFQFFRLIFIHESLVDSLWYVDVFNFRIIYIISWFVSIKYFRKSIFNKNSNHSYSQCIYEFDLAFRTRFPY